MGIKMDRLDYSVPEFLRTVWVSQLAKDYWETKIHRISDSWKFVERHTLLQDMRNGILQSISPEELPEVQVWAMKNNVPMIIVGMEGVSFGNASAPYVPGRSFNYRVYFGLEPHEFLRAWKDSDDTIIGRCLDFPECCINFFRRYWKAEGWRDLTYHSYDEQHNQNQVYNNVLLRHIGIRGIFHLPCSVGCIPSCELGETILEIMDSAGYQKEVTWLRDLLSMPMRWSSLHGIAVVTTPILKTIYSSDALPRKAVLDLTSDYYPTYGASGNQFPFMHVKPMQLARKPYLNGFKTQESMDAGHYFITGCIGRLISGRILDLGCGNGRLLQRIKDQNPDVLTYGVENNSEAINSMVGYSTVTACDILDFTWDLYYDITMIAIQRFFEFDPDKAIQLLETIHKHSDKLLIYSYDGWIGGFEHIIDKHFSIEAVDVDSKMNFKATLLTKRKVFNDRECNTES